jgi:hypothetical protein
MPKQSSVTLLGTVEKIIPSSIPGTPEKAQISVQSAEPLYREVRIENTLTDESGGKVSLKPGSQVDVIITADASTTVE